MGRQSTYDEYAHIMTGFLPDQVPVLSGIAREFGALDHWFCEVPSQTFMNRSFWTAATSSGLLVNSPAAKWFPFLQRVYDAYRSATSQTGANVWNTALLNGWDEPGGTYDHVPPGPVPPPNPAAPARHSGTSACTTSRR